MREIGDGRVQAQWKEGTAAVRRAENRSALQPAKYRRKQQFTLMNYRHTPCRKQAGGAFWRSLAIVLFLGQQTVTLCYGAGTVLAWGSPDGSPAPSGLTNVVAVAGGVSHSLALKGDGTVVAWGDNLFGQATVPADLTAVASIAGGATYSMALCSNGTVVVWGSQPAPPDWLTNVVAIAAGWSHSLAVLSDGTVFSWGTQTAVPAGLSNVVSVAAGNGHSVALRSDGSVIAWGNNAYNKTNVPPAVSNIVAIAAGGDHCLALQRNGTVFGWGRNDRGQTTIPSSLSAVAIAAGALHSLALKMDSTMTAWGDNTYGQTVVNPTDSGYIAVAAGGYHNLAIKGDGKPYILVQPFSQSVLISKSVTFQVVATGNQPLSYQWQHEGTNLLGATRSSLTIANVQGTDAGSYIVRVFNAYGSVNSSAAILTALAGVPTIVVPPQNQTVICGDSTSFQVSAGGTTPLSYQWYFQSRPIAGATQTSLQLTNVTPADAGEYTVIVANPFGVASTGAVLTVTVQPPRITSPLTASGTQGQPFTYTIRALHTPISFAAIFLPTGLTVNTNTGVISGTPQEGGVYAAQITAFNACSSDTRTLAITIASSLPVITSPVTANGTEGMTFNYQITATASPIAFGASNLPVGLNVDPLSGLISGAPVYAGEYDSTIWASNIWGAGSANLHFTFGNLTIDNLNIGSVSYTYSKPYLLDFQFSIFTTIGDTNDAASPTTGLVIDPRLLTATCMEDGVTNSPSETGSFIVQGNRKLVKVAMVLDFTESIASLNNGDANGDGISDAVEFMIEGAQDFVNQQSFDTRINVWEFHRDDWAPSNVVALTTDKVLLNQKIAGIYTNFVKGFSSGSRCWDAATNAIFSLGSSNQNEQHYVVFVSDGRDESSFARFTNVLAAATNNNVKIFALGFGDELDATTLQTLATETQGRYYSAGTNASELATQFAEITKTSKSQYILRWATLKRAARQFMPSFAITYKGFTAFSPTNPITVGSTNIDTTVDPPVTNITPDVTNYIIGWYDPSKFAPPPPVTAGQLYLAANAEVMPTGVDLRAFYIPRNIRTMRLHYRANWPCTATLQSTDPGELLSGWSMVETNDGAGGSWLLLSSSNPTNPTTSLPFASMGPLITFTFRDVINPSNTFSLLEVDNTLYTNTGGQTFIFDAATTNGFIKPYPVLPYGTPVPWLMTYGYSGNFTNAEILDPDGDGMKNWQEYRANTIPTNAASKLEMRGVIRLLDGRFLATFSTSTNRSYRLEASTDLNTWDTVQADIPGTGQDVTVTDTRFLPNITTIFYRVVVY
jgi:hypothetical protein